jgi:hypothetical protein
MVGWLIEPGSPDTGTTIWSGVFCAGGGVGEVAKRVANPMVMAFMSLFIVACCTLSRKCKACTFSNRLNSMCLILDRIKRGVFYFITALIYFDDMGSRFVRMAGSQEGLE